jgi:hypothetical protein
MLVCDMRERMPEAEFQGWLRYFRVKAQTQELDGKVAASRMGR